MSALSVLGIGTSLATFALGVRPLPDGWSCAAPGFDAIKEEGLELLRTGRWLWIAAIFAMLAANLDVLVLYHLSTPSVVGAYALALNLATKAQVVNHSLYTVLLTNAARVKAAMRRARSCKQGLLRTAAIAAGLLLLLPLAEPFILIVYGADYAPSIDLFRSVARRGDLRRAGHAVVAAADGLSQATPAGGGRRGPRGHARFAVLLLPPALGAIGAVIARFASRVIGAVLVLLALRRQQ